jgi:hypothetical protein
MGQTYSIIILDSQGKKFGELMAATQTEILQFINKGFTVIDRSTNQQITQESVVESIGVSDGCIILG